MKKHIIIGLFSLLVWGPFYSAAVADEPPKVVEKGTPATKAARSTPFHGKIDAFDAAAKTLKVGARQFVVTESTKIVKGGKPASIEDVQTGLEIGGAYREGAEGKLELVSMRIGPKPEKEKKQ